MKNDFRRMTKFGLIFLMLTCMIMTISPNGFAKAEGNLQTTPPGNRPLLYIAEYSVDGGGKNVDPYKPFKLIFTIGNNGQPDAHARNILITFSGEDFNSLDGGVSATHEVDGNNQGNVTMEHHFKVSDASSWKYSGNIIGNVSYTNYDGTMTYTEVFTFSLGINQGPSGPTRTPTAPASAQKPLMIVKSYLTDLDPLQPGSHFKLKLFVSNVGSSQASSVSLVYGGGVTTNPSEALGTPQPGSGGVTVSGSELTNFAPLGQSNIIQLGNISVGTVQETEQEFVVNVSTQPGAYPLKISFVYTDPRGMRMVDDQVITLLVFSLPKLEVSLYRHPISFHVGEPGPLPIQITNIAKKNVVLGNLTVSAASGELTNNTGMVGNLDPGGYYTLDAMFTPSQEGKTPLKFEIRYTDDFNQLRTFNASLEVDVQPAISQPDAGLQPLLDAKGNPVLDDKGNPVMVPANPDTANPGGQQNPQQEQSFFAKLWNAIKSFFGVNPASGNSAPNEPMPSDGFPAGGGKGG
ncbi:MAG: hypothetical protein VB108_08530 [Anaerolineaceae bacterium]|nr:hypothetical protein [Anaerolineaceae bacterium]